MRHPGSRPQPAGASLAASASRSASLRSRRHLRRSNTKLRLGIPLISAQQVRGNIVLVHSIQSHFMRLWTLMKGSRDECHSKPTLTELMATKHPQAQLLVARLGKTNQEITKRTGQVTVRVVHVNMCTRVGAFACSTFT